MQSSKSFSLEIEKIAKEKNITHMEAVLEHCRIQEMNQTQLRDSSLKV